MTSSFLPNPGVFALPPRQLWPFFGLWTMQVWIYWANTSAALPAAPLFGLPSWAWLYGTMTLAMLCCAMVHWAAGHAEEDGRPSSGPLDLIFTVCMCATTVSIQACAWATAATGTGSIWALANAMCSGIVMAWGYLRWSVIYARMPIRDAVGCLFFSYLVGSTIKIVLDAVPTVLGTAIACMLPVVSYVSVHRALGAEWPRPTERLGEMLYRRDTLAPLGRLAICVFVFCLVRVVVSLTSNWGEQVLLSRTLSHLIEIAFALVALWLVFLREHSLDFPQLWRFVFFFLATSLLVGCASDTAGFDLGIGPRVFSSVGTSLLVMLLWLLLTDVAHHSDLHPYVVFGIGWSLYVGSNFLGPAAMSLLGLTAMTPLLGLALVYALGMTMVFCLETSGTDAQRIFADMRKKVAPEEFATIDERCTLLGHEYGLTDREIEVMQFLAKGRSKGYIAEELVVSENTVRGHARHLYAKLDIHTKAELQDLLGL